MQLVPARGHCYCRLSLLELGEAGPIAELAAGETIDSSSRCRKLNLTTLPARDRVGYSA